VTSFGCVRAADLYRQVVARDQQVDVAPGFTSSAPPARRCPANGLIVQPDEQSPLLTPILFGIRPDHRLMRVPIDGRPKSSAGSAPSRSDRPTPSLPSFTDPRRSMTSQCDTVCALRHRRFPLLKRVGQRIGEDEAKALADLNEMARTGAWILASARFGTRINAG